MFNLIFQAWNIKSESLDGKEEILLILITHFIW